MKKSHAENVGHLHPVIPKLVRIMKLTIVCMLLAVMSVSANGFSQEAKVTLSLRNVKLTKLFKAIEKQTGYRFAYSNDVLPDDRVVSVQVEDKPVTEILEAVLPSMNVKHRYIEDAGIIVVSEKTTGSFVSGEELIVPARVITGKVMNDQGEPLEGVTVAVKGTGKSTVTGAGGLFSIEVEDNNLFLVFSYVDMESQELSIAGRNSLEVKLASSQKSLEDVVIVGYGTESKRKITSSVSSVKPKELELMPATNLSNVIAGRMPGVNVTTAGGRPGTASNIQIRGASVGPFAGTTAPLFVIDNVIATKELFDLLDVNEVEDISILKDAAAAAVYGARASNGVVLVKTRSGKKGKPVIQATGTFGTSNELRRPKFTTAHEHALLINQAIKAGLDPLIPNSTQGTIPFTPAELQYLKDNPYPNTIDVIRRNATFQRYALNFSGATDVVDYFVGGNYVKETGPVPNTDYSKYGLRANVGINLTKNLKATLNTNITRDNDYEYFWNWDGESRSDSYRQAMRRGGWGPSYINGLPVANFNAFSMVNMMNNGMGDRTRTTDFKNFIVNLDYKIPFIKGLNAGLSYNNRQVVNINTTWQRPLVDYVFDVDPTNQFRLLDKVVGERVFITTGINNNSIAKTSITDNAYQLNAKLNYDRNFGDHSIKAMLIYEQSESFRDQYNGIRRNLLSPDVQQIFASSTRVEDRDFSGQQFEVGRLSYIASLAYAFRDKYYVNASVRRDGSVAFAPGRQYGNFPSISAGWLISEEKFFQNVKFMDFLKLRGSFGRTGNDNITGAGNEYPAYAYLAGYSVASAPGSLILGNSNASNSVINVGGFPASNATWDKSDMYNLGLDMAFLKNKLTATVEVFRNKRYDMFAQRISIVPVELGSAPPRVNYGALQVQGLDFSANYRDNINKNASFNVAFNIGFAKDKVLQFDETPEREFNRLTGNNSDRIWGYVADGILRSQAELDKLRASGYKFNNQEPFLGMVLIRDIRGNATVDPKGNTPDGKVDANDLTWIGNRSTPAYNYGITLGFKYKNISVEAFIQGLGGFQKYVPPVGRFTIDVVGDAAWSWWNDAFEPDTNPNGSMPRFASWFANGDPIGTNSTFWLKDASFARFRNLNVSYQLPQSISKKVGIRNASVFYNGMNLFFLFSKVKEWDPELQGEGMPLNRTHSFGIQLSL